MGPKNGTLEGFLSQKSPIATPSLSKKKKEGGGAAAAEAVDLREPLVQVLDKCLQSTTVC